MAENSPDVSKGKKSSVSNSTLHSNVSTPTFHETDSKEKTSRQRSSKRDIQDSVRLTRRKEGTLRERFHFSRNTKSVKPSVIGVLAEDSTKGNTKKEESARQGKTGAGTEYYDLIEKREAKLTFPPGTPLDIRISKEMTVAHLPEIMRDRGLDLGDWITAINGVPVKSRSSYTVNLRKLRDECKEKLEITYKVDRLRRIQQIKNPQECQAIHQAYEVNPGCDYLFAILSLFPGSSLGLSIKSFSGKIFVSSVDNGFKSLAMRTFLVGDAILSVNGHAVSSVSEADEKIITELKTKKPVKFVVERAVSPAAVFNVKLALGAEKTIELNPRLMNDVIDICQQELNRMDNNKDGEQLRSILREKKKKQGSAQLTFSDASSETSIGMDPVNPIFLTKAPPRPSAESCRGKKIPRR